MNDNAKAWVAALRSGEFKQGSGALHTADGSYCCLGVACELHRRDHGGQWLYNSYLGKHGLLPYEVMQWLGLCTIDGQHHDQDGLGESSLDELNDRGGLTFDEIADIIEKEPKGLFS